MKGILCLVLFVASITVAVKADVTEEDIDLMTDNIILTLDRKIDVLDEEDGERSLNTVKESLKTIGHKLGSLIKNIWKKIPKERLKKAVKGTIADVKDSIVEKGKKFVITEGRKQAKSFLKHEVIKFIKKTVFTESCECAIETKCGCCIKAPALEKGCFNMTAIPQEKKFRIKVTYGGEVLIGKKISGDQEVMSCTHLPSPLDVSEICIITQGIQEIDASNFRSCFRIVSHGLEVSKCILFENGKASLY